MVPLPLFKFASLFVRQFSKYGANWIKNQAHDHPKFRTIAARYGQSLHQLNMRMQVALLRDPAAERRARERAEAPTVKTEEQTKADEKAHKEGKTSSHEHQQSVWKRKFRTLPESKAVDLFADVIGDVFILSVAGALIIYEYVRTKSKPDTTAEKFAELDRLVAELKEREEELEKKNEEHKARVETLEKNIEELTKPITGKKGFLSLS
ncbi:optic atrophy 3-like protein [Xylogone sp. PMI_703]|nr:optic atrophy 3-like protein [Xylogone sp. PMI_703]